LPAADAAVVVRFIAASVTTSSARRCACLPPKECRAPYAPCLLRRSIFGGNGIEQRTGKLLDRQCIGTAGDDQLAKLEIRRSLSLCARSFSAFSSTS
jgi:hypothetical protein